MTGTVTGEGTPSTGPTDTTGSTGSSSASSASDSTGSIDPAGAGAPPRRLVDGYRIGLALAAVLGAAIRAVNILVVRPTCAGDLVELVEAGRGPRPNPANDCFAIWGDSLYGYVQGRMIARGDWFIGSADWFLSGGTRLVPSAGDPPLYALFLGFFAKLGLTSGTAARLVSAAAGVVGVVLIGVVAARIAGRRAGVIAALIAAICPMLWMNDGMLLSEALYVPLIALSMLGGYRFWHRPTFANAALLGAAITLAALTRAEALLLFGFLLLPLAWGLREVPWARRAALVAVSGAVGVAMLLPWFAYNASRFEEPVFMTSGTGAVLLAGSCDPAYYGEYIGYYGANCYDDYVRTGMVQGDPRLPGCDADAVAAAFVDPLARTAEDTARLGRCYPDPKTQDESQRDKISRDFAVAYIKNHKRDTPLVMAARVGRMWDVYAPAQNVRLNYQVEGRGEAASWAGLWVYYACIPFGLYGAVVLFRRRIPLSPLLAMAGVITITAAITFGVTRYRVPADVMFAVLAAVGIDALVRRARPGGNGGGGDGDDDDVELIRRGRRGAGAPAVTTEPATTPLAPETVHA